MTRRKLIVSGMTVVFGMVLILGFLLSGGFVYLYFFAILIGCASFLREPLSRAEWLQEGIVFILVCGLIYVTQHFLF
ncbi:hypothetical protein [Exiguobacterium sp. s193]|uniref:hypothetical protein n=1 Tax=Exiguobacterium sp. s193 TaxID=2751207 RepID=UPI001BE7A118|nr:hypothetical protein [Exiguobacterium sp. s193]